MIYVSQISRFFPPLVLASPFGPRGFVGCRRTDGAAGFRRFHRAESRRDKGGIARPVGGGGVPTAADGWGRTFRNQTDVKRPVAFMRSHNLYIKQAPSNSARLNLRRPTRETGRLEMFGGARRSALGARFTWRKREILALFQKKEKMKFQFAAEECGRCLSGRLREKPLIAPPPPAGCCREDTSHSNQSSNQSLNLWNDIFFLIQILGFQFLPPKQKAVVSLASEW